MVSPHVDISQKGSSLDFRAELLWLGFGGAVTYDLFVLGSKRVYTVGLLTCVFVCSLWAVLLVCMLTCLRHTHIWLCVQSRALILLCDNLFYSLTAMPCLRIQRKENLYPNIPLVISPVSSSFPIFRTFPLPPHRLSSPSPLLLFLSDVCTRKKTKSVALSFLPHYFVISQSNNFAFPQREIHGAALHMPGHAEQKEKERE